MGVLTLIALSFTLQKVDVLTVVFKENGFDLLDMKSIFISEEFAWGSALIGSFGILQLCLSLVTIVISVVSFFIFSAQTNKTCCMALNIASLAFLFLYLLEGVIFNSIYNGVGAYIEGVSFDEYASDPSTSSYIPFIIGCIIMAGYFVCTFIINDNFALPNVSKVRQTKSWRAQDYEVVADTLKKYKELLDSGIITQEEFYLKKQEILK